jgi:hypothetical protein
LGLARPETLQSLDEKSSLRLDGIDDESQLSGPPELQADIEVPAREEDGHPRVRVIPADSLKIVPVLLEEVDLAVELRPGLL